MSCRCTQGGTGDRAYQKSQTGRGLRGNRAGGSQQGVQVHSASSGHIPDYQARRPHP